MASKYVVAGSSDIQEMRDTGFQPQNLVIRVVAIVISVLFHPLFVPVYLVWFLSLVQPFFFGLTPASGNAMTILRFFVIYSFFPLVTVLLAKGLGFLKSVYLKTQKDRIIPYIACEIYYFWMCYVFRHQSDMFAPELIQLTMAIFIATSLALIANIYMKVSMHAIGMGIAVMFLTVLALHQGVGFTVYLTVGLLVSGLVCTSRMIVSDHRPAEIYVGFLLGAASMLAAIWADGILP